jgi:isopentenyl phosphate kinase
MKTKKLFLVKLGGSIITDKNKEYFARMDLIKKLAKEIYKSKAQLVIAHGSGSFAHTSATKYGGKKGYKNLLGVATVARDAMEINRIVMDELIKAKIPAVSFRPMSMILTNAGKIKFENFQILENALAQGLVPVVYGDVLWDQSWKSTIFSGEHTLNLIGIYLSTKGYVIKKIIQVGQTDGVYDDKNNIISEINSKNWNHIKEYIFNSKAKDVTGGIMHKIEDALIMAKMGIKTILINGNRRNDLLNALEDKNVKGTVIH